MIYSTDVATKDGEEVSALFFTSLKEAEEVAGFFEDSVELEIEEGASYHPAKDEMVKGYFLFSCFQQEEEEEEEQPDEATLQETGLIPAFPEDF